MFVFILHEPDIGIKLKPVLGFLTKLDCEFIFDHIENILAVNKKQY